MATYKEMQNRHLSLSEKASVSVKTNALSGIAAVWVISHPVKDSTSIFFQQGSLFAISALIYIIAIGLDLMSSFLGSLLIWIFLQQLHKEYKDKKVERDKIDFDVPRWVSWTSWIFYGLKIAAVLGATGVLIFAVVSTS